jgi:predicted transposase YbfD/YdcC
MDVGVSRGLLRFFDELEDPRVDRTKLHSLGDILFITLCAVICGADDWTEVELFGTEKEEWLRQFLILANGIPSHDTFGRVFTRLDPVQLERCFLNWMSSLSEASKGRLIAIDGKTLRGSFDSSDSRMAIHMVSAWCEENQLVLGQLATEEKSNEITAIPRLLEMLDIQGAVVTIDAMGCQKAIAGEIVSGGGDYVLAVKENQPALHDMVTGIFAELTGPGIPGVTCEYYEETGAGHGRIETRSIWTTGWIDWWKDGTEWAGLKSVVCVESTRRIKEHSSTERRYFISSIASPNPVTMLGHVRGHWGIENKLHWSLDVTFREDTLRNRVGHSAENFSRIRRLALNLLRKEKSTRKSVKCKRLKACMKNDYLIAVVGQGI